MCGFSSVMPEPTICRKTSPGRSTVPQYQWYPAPTKRHQQRLGKQQRERETTMEDSQRPPALLRNAANTSSERLNALPSAHWPPPARGLYSQPETADLPNGGGEPASVRKEEGLPGRTQGTNCGSGERASVQDHGPDRQNSTRHQAVLRFLYHQRSQKGKETGRQTKHITMHRKGRPQSMPFPLDYHNFELAGKPKGINRVLNERGFWRGRGLVLGCPTAHNRPCCNAERIAVLAESLRTRGISRLERTPARGDGSTGSSSFLPAVPL